MLRSQGQQEACCCVCSVCVLPLPSCVTSMQQEQGEISHFFLVLLPKLICKVLVYKTLYISRFWSKPMLTSVYLKLGHTGIFEPSLRKSVCTHKTITSYGVDLALSLLLSCKLPARLVTHWWKVRGNVTPLVGFGDLQPLCVLANMKFIWTVAWKDRWNAGSHSSSCWEAIVFLVSELLYREAHPTSVWGEGTSPFTYSTATKCRFTDKSK